MNLIKDIDQAQKGVKEIISNPTLTHEQQMMRLSSFAQNLLDYPEGTPEEFFTLFDEGIICDLSEGHVQYAPRYILPDYDKFLKEGSEFLRLAPAKTLYEAITNLLICYRHVPSVTHFPVYLGHIDRLLEPFIEDEDTARELIKGFLIQMDRTLNSSFCHANIGPAPTRAGRIILELEQELQNAVPNMTICYDTDKTTDEFATLAVETTLKCANPAFANHKNYVEDFNNSEKYGIVSCYNGLPVAGGAFTLSRLRLVKIAEKATSVEQFFNETLPQSVDVLCRFMECKIDYLVNETPFFETNFLVKEKLIEKERFVGLFGMVGLAECVNNLMAKQGLDDKFGHSEKANLLGVEVLDKLKELVDSFESKYGEIWNNRFMLHAQVGAEGDDGVSPGARIPIGEEPDLYTHLKNAGLYHKYFTSGIGDHFPFDTTSCRNPEAILDIVKGAYKVGMRYISAYASDGDLIRVTGYLVKKSDVAKFGEGSQIINETVGGSYDNIIGKRIYDRKVRNI